VEISQIGHSIVHTPKKDLHLNKVLYVPEESKHLVSVHRLIRITTSLWNFTQIFFVKDRATKKPLLQGMCERGLYPPRAFPSKNKSAFALDKVSSTRWHSRLGHPSSAVVRQVLSKNNLSFGNEFNKNVVCDVCQKGKHHQLPYPKSISRSFNPLDLVFSDVWGPASTSVG
jgi:hypothetical protein